MADLSFVNHCRSFSRGIVVRVPLIILNHFRGTLDTWDPAFLDTLAKERTIVIFDSAGVGISEGKTPDNITAAAVIAQAFIRSIGLKQVDVLGWSMGGAIAQRLALDSPDLVRKVVVAGSGPDGVPEAPKAPAKVWEVANWQQRVESRQS